MAAVGAAVALSACGGASASRPAASAVAARPTASAIRAAIAATVTAATGVHVAGAYSLPRFRAQVSLDLLASGQFAGTVSQGKISLVEIETGGKLYGRVTASLLRAAHKAGECPVLCGKYFAMRASTAAGMIQIVGMAATVSLLSAVADGFSGYTITTYNGQRAYRLPLTDMASGATAYVAATAACQPLAVYDPGVVTLIFSQWNDVKASAAPPMSQMVPNLLGSHI